MKWTFMSAGGENDVDFILRTLGQCITWVYSTDASDRKSQDCKCSIAESISPVLLILVRKRKLFEMVTDFIDIYAYSYMHKHL